jgi:hypothetical protein
MEMKKIVSIHFIFGRSGFVTSFQFGASSALAGGAFLFKTAAKSFQNSSPNSSTFK